MADMFKNIMTVATCEMLGEFLFVPKAPLKKLPNLFVLLIYIFEKQFKTII